MKNVNLSAKSDEIKKITFKILDSFDEGSLEVVDYWDVDLCAIGFKILKRKEGLLYISTYKIDPCEYYYEVEGGICPEGVSNSGNVNETRLLEILNKLLSN